MGEIITLVPPDPNVCPDCEWFGRAQSCLRSLQSPTSGRGAIEMARVEIECTPRANSNLHVDMSALAYSKTSSPEDQTVYPLVVADLHCLKLLREHPTQGFEPV